MIGMMSFADILANCRRVVPNDGVLLLVECPIPEGNLPSAGKVGDIVHDGTDWRQGAHVPSNTEYCLLPPASVSIRYILRLPIL